MHVFAMNVLDTLYPRCLYPWCMCPWYMYPWCIYLWSRILMHWMCEWCTNVWCMNEWCICVWCSYVWCISMILDPWPWCMMGVPWAWQRRRRRRTGLREFSSWMVYHSCHMIIVISSHDDHHFITSSWSRKDPTYANLLGLVILTYPYTFKSEFCI